MTTLEFLALLGRRWPIALICMLAAWTSVVFASMHVEVVYWSQGQVVLLAPRSVDVRNNLSSTTPGVIATAGVVAHEIAESSAQGRTSSSEVTLYGQGVRDGVQAIQPDAGGQWSSNFNQSVIDVQAVASDSDKAAQMVADKMNEASAVLETLQTEYGVPRGQRITMTLAPAQPTVRVVQGSPIRVAAGVLVLGGASTVALLVALDRVMTSARLPGWLRKAAKNESAGH